MDAAEYAGWVVNRGEPHGRMQMLDPPRRAVVTTRTYAGHTVTLQLYAVSRAPGWVCVRQDRLDRSPWHAWVPAAEVTPV